MTTEASFSTLPLSEANFASGSVPWMVDKTALATTSSDLTVLQLYFRIGSAETLNMLLEEPPSIGEVLSYALREPGLRVQELTVELLGRLSERTLQFALLALPSNYHYFRRVYSDKVWEIVISALGIADTTYAGFIEEYMLRLLDDPNPVKRLAAFDALETLRT